MGFHLSITCNLEISKENGMHFYYKDSQKIYGMPPDIPEEHREYVRMRGNLFRIYAEFVTDETSTSVENFFDKFPTWSDIVEEHDFEPHSEGWTEGQHDKFYAALKWFSDEKINYTISWT